MRCERSAASPPASSWRCCLLCRQLCCRRSPLCFSKVLKARALPPDRVGPGIVRGAWLRGGCLHSCGGKARAPTGSLCLLHWLAAGAPAWSGLHRHCLLPAGASTRPPLLLWWLLSARPASTGASFLWWQLPARATLWSCRPCSRKALGLSLGLRCGQSSGLTAAAACQPCVLPVLDGWHQQSPQAHKLPGRSRRRLDLLSRRPHHSSKLCEETCYWATPVTPLVDADSAQQRLN